MVLHDYPRFNNVWLAEDGQVAAFGRPPAGQVAAAPLAFTGVQVVSPRVFNLIPPKTFVSIIDTYRQAISDGDKVAGAVQNTTFIGTISALPRITWRFTVTC